MAEERLNFGSPWNVDDLVFCRSNGDRIDGSHVSHWLRAALKKAELPRIKVHGLRHTAASLHLAEGTHAKLVQEMLGHSTIMLTLDTYSHVLPALHVEAASVMDRLFRSA
jgi:integrase